MIAATIDPIHAMPSLLEKIAFQPADDRTEDAQDHRGDPSHRLFAWQEQPCEGADDQSRDDRQDDVEEPMSSMVFRRSLPRCPLVGEPCVASVAGSGQRNVVPMDT